MSLFVLLFRNYSLIGVVGAMIFDKRSKNYQMEKKAYLTIGAGITRYQHVEK